MTKLETAKKTIKWVSAYGSGIITYAIIRNNVDYDNLPAHKKASVAVASVSIGGAVAEVAENYTDRLFDEVATVYKTLTKKN